ncbi:MAG: hypothetical protein ABIJ31_02505 [Pseudomonadota bacterium]
MLAFLKKFKKSGKQPEPISPDHTADSKAEDTPKKDSKKDSKKPQPESTEPDQPRKKKFPVKLILVILMVLIAIGGSGFAVYTLYLTPGKSDTKTVKYKKIQLNHVELPDEILKFSFQYLPDLYTAMVTYNVETDLIDAQILRIQAIGQKYPDQIKITDKEKQTWEKTRDKLENTFLKIQKPVKEIYVLFRVNKEQGLIQIDTRQAELIELANTALAPVQELTGKLKSEEKVPEGLINSTLYKLKKKFL